jgi:iron complex transport system ATP-binding protein
MIETFFHVCHGDVWRGETLALRDLSLSLNLGESIAILGANGAGKSSLLKLMTGELRVAARSGATCRLWGEEQWCLEELRHRIGIVMPEEVARFSPNELAEDVVRSAFRGSYGRTGDMRFRAAEKDAASEVMKALGILALKNREFGALSSGEKRRFLIARALVFEPEVLVLDEPSTALDFAARLQMLERLRGLRTTLVLVTHDPAEILPEIERVIFLKEGRIIADGPKCEVLRSKSLSELYGMELKLRMVDEWPVVRPVR